jgi:pimeloyl-ACP methyl ester carboxylesterase
MVHTMGWRSVFWINLPLVAISLVAAAILMKPSEKEATPIDWSSASLFSVSLAMFMVSLTIIDSSVPRLVVVLMFAVSIALIIIFFRREVHVVNPIIDVSILRKRPFLALNMYNIIYGACVLGFFSFIPLYAVSVYNMSTLESGLILTPRSVAMILGSLVTSYFLPKWGYRWPLLAGTAFTIVTLVLLAIHPMDFKVFGLDIKHITLLFLIMALGGLGGGISAPASNNASIELMPHRVATITGIRNMFRMGGGSVGTVVATLILNRHPDAARGFTLLFGALAAGLCLAIPLIFAVPRRAENLATAVGVAKSGDLQR